MSSCSRTEILIGKEGLIKLANAHVVITGVGGVGGICAESLVRAGIGEITIIDFDKIELSDTNRQLVAMHSTLEKQKIDVLEQRLRDINPSCKINAENVFIDEEKAIQIARSDATFVADCIDSIFYKTMLIEHCLAFDKKIISSMGAGGKLDGSQVEITTMKKTFNCGLAREMRRRLKEKKVSMSFPVVFSSEVNKKALPHAEVSESQYATAGRARATNGTISYMPNIFGLIMSSYIINNILKHD